MSSLSNAELGTLGENLVAQWLQSQGWTILERQWRCRWGELDLVAMRWSKTGQGSSQSQNPLLAFVEVKTRSRGNWDANGLMAVTPQKQTKLWQSARLYLAQRPEQADFNCRFDVALVACCQTGRRGSALGLATQPYQPNQALILQDYIENAFDGP